MSRKKTHVQKGDEVQVISGNHKGKTGTVLEVNAEKEQVIVEGVRVMKKSVRRSEQNPDGGLIDKDGPVHLSNVKKVS
ncbi:MAG: 50S ribosomal protein L24 [Akkermansiaceae bacterium]|jgi:large subunit ribosomal protein L24|nr:50S ribosomal protein L24 [Akkermansiaceae bacterium]